MLFYGLVSVPHSESLALLWQGTNLVALHAEKLEGRAAQIFDISFSYDGTIHHVVINIADGCRKVLWTFFIPGG